MSENFADRLLDKIKAKGAPVCVGIDPVYSRLPADISQHRELNDETDTEAALDAVLEYCRRVIRIVAPIVPAVKINVAYFERYYWEGLEGYYELVQEAAERDLIVIGDVKRGDVGHSAEMYARAHLARSDFANMDDLVLPDAVTVNSYFGSDGVRPFIDVARSENKGVFVLVRTSNESAGELQEFRNADGATLADHLACQVTTWANDAGLVGESGYSAVGAVVAARDAESTMRLRSLMPNSIFLVPGFKTQGTTAEAVLPCFKSDGTGALITASRSVLYAYEDIKYIERFASEWEKCVEQACRDFVAEINGVLAAHV